MVDYVFFFFKKTNNTTPSKQLKTNNNTPSKQLKKKKNNTIEATKKKKKINQQKKTHSYAIFPYKNNQFFYDYSEINQKGPPVRKT
jgi:hypothetical protein